jgi:hypothetical protein
MVEINTKILIPLLIPYRPHLLAANLDIKGELLSFCFGFLTFPGSYRTVSLSALALSLLA